MKIDLALPPATRFLTDADVRSVFDWKDAIKALRAAYSAPAAPASFPPRSMARGDGVWLRTLSGVLPDSGVMGAKLIAANTKARAASYLIPLFDQETMALCGMMDAHSITGFRTAATSTLAVDALSSPGNLRVAVIGSGFEAKTHLRALAATRVLEHVTVFSPSPDSRLRFIAELADLSLPIDQADKAEMAVADANLVLCTARSRDESPIMWGAWLRPGMTLVSIGSTLPEQRELDPEAIDRADLIVADMPEEVAHDTGDMLVAAREGIAFAEKLVSLHAVIGGAVAGRTTADQIILYKSVGAAIQDLAVAAMCLRRACEAGLGTLLPVTIMPVGK